MLTLNPPVLEARAKAGKRRRRILLAVLLMLVAALAYYLVSLVQVYTFGLRHTAARAKVAVVLGAAEYDGRPSADLQARLNQALHLFLAGDVKMIMTTGGSERGDVYTEAGAGRDYLVSHGVPKSDVVVDGVGSDTYQSVASVAARLKAMGLGTAVFVSDPFHEFRVSQIAASLGILSLPSPTMQSPIRGTLELDYYLREAVAVSAARITGYKFLSVLRHGN